MVTSALPGEGKTFTAVNLAMSIAMEFDNTVLLVDGDVAHPSLPSVLGVPPSPGPARPADRATSSTSPTCCVKTNIEKLTILPAGSRHRRATELLASEQMASLLRELASRYPDRIIIFDSPPLLATTEARVLATHMGQIVMVVAADSTTQHAVKQALATIESCEIVLMMLNKASKTDVGTLLWLLRGRWPRYAPSRRRGALRGGALAGANARASRLGRRLRGGGCSAASSRSASVAAMRADLAPRAVGRACRKRCTNNVNLQPIRTSAQGDLVTQITPTLAIDEKGARTSLAGAIARPVLLYAKTGARKQQGLSRGEPARQCRELSRSSSMSRARSTSRSSSSTRSARSRRASPTRRRTATRRRPIG